MFEGTINGASVSRRMRGPEPEPSGPALVSGAAASAFGAAMWRRRAEVWRLVA